MQKRKSKSKNLKELICNEILPRIEVIDARDREQFDNAKKIIEAANEVFNARITENERIVKNNQNEIDKIIHQQDKIVKKLTDSLDGLHQKFDEHKKTEDEKFSEIKQQLEDIYLHGTKLARQIDENLNSIKVNGGIFPLTEAFQFLYSQQSETYKKLDEVAALTEGIGIRKRWIKNTKDLIKKNGILSFFLTTKVGVFLATIFVLLTINTIAKDVFKIDIDLFSVFKWFFNLFSRS